MILIAVPRKHPPKKKQEGGVTQTKLILILRLSQNLQACHELPGFLDKRGMFAVPTPRHLPKNAAIRCHALLRCRGLAEWVLQVPIKWRYCTLKGCSFNNNTIDGRDPARVDIVDIPSFTGFYTSQVGFWISSINSTSSWFSFYGNGHLNFIQ